MSQTFDKQAILERCLTSLTAVSVGVAASEISTRDSLTGTLVLDSLLLATFVARLQDEFPGVDMTPWFMSKTRAGDDTLANLAEFICDAVVTKGVR